MYTEVIQAYVDELNVLKNSGVQNFLLMNVPPLDKSPNAITQGGRLTEYFNAIRFWNKEFASAISRFAATCPECTVFQYDLNAFMNNLLKPDESSRIGVKETRAVYCDSYSTLVDQPLAKFDNCSYAVNEYYWLNIVHPTWPIMREIAADAASFMSSSK